MKNIEIRITVWNEDTGHAIALKSAKDFESAAENLGKLERYIKKLQAADAAFEEEENSCLSTEDSVS